MQKANVQRISEHAKGGFVKENVDTENKTIKDVALLGHISANGRTYSPNALNDAKNKLEGTRVFLNHRRENLLGFEPHDVKNYVGRVYGTYIKDNKVYAQTFQVLNESHQDLIGIAESDAEAFGFSIDAMAVIGEDNDVESITEVFSVDVVSQPATVKGVFEQKESNDGDESMDWTKVDLAGLRENRSDLVSALSELAQADLVKENKELKADIDKLRLANATATVEALLTEYGVDEPSDTLKESLLKAGPEGAKAILEETAGHSKRIAEAGDETSGADDLQKNIAALWETN